MLTKFNRQKKFKIKEQKKNIETILCKLSSYKINEHMKIFINYCLFPKI